MTGNLFLATALLMLGVALVAATAETGVFWWGLAGHLCLLFVPALIAAHVVERLRRER